MLTLYVLIATALTGTPCAAIDNRTNTAVWAHQTPHGTTYTRTHYADYGDNLGYDVPVPRPVWNALQRTEKALQEGKPAHKIPVRCAEGRP